MVVVVRCGRVVYRRRRRIVVARTGIASHRRPRRGASGSVSAVWVAVEVLGVRLGGCVVIAMASQWPPAWSSSSSLSSTSLHHFSCMLLATMLSPRITCSIIVVYSSSWLCPISQDGRGLFVVWGLMAVWGPPLCGVVRRALSVAHVLVARPLLPVSVRR